MQTTIPAPGPISWWRRPMPAAVALGLLLVFGCAQTAAAQNAGAQNNLRFFDNFFVTGDYAVGGVSLIGKGSGGFSTGTISIGADANPGVKGTNSVPQGAEVVAALLYWQTIETLGVMPGQAGSGQSGTFRPLIKNGPQTGYSIQGTALPNPNGTVFWDSSGCNITSSKQLVTYRSEVRAFLPQDANGNVLANGSYEVRLPTNTSSSGSGTNESGTPNTIGATLVIIYRVLSPNFPLNSIVIYDGTYAPTAALLTTMQTVQGFYQAAATPVSKLTYIVSGGTGNLRETVSLNGVSLPSLYGNMPPYPGWYPGGHWDNPSWIFGPSLAITNPPNPIKPNLVLGNDASATTVINNVKQGCVGTAAIIFSSTVQNSDGDGLLDVWKARQGYCDASFNEAGNNSTPFKCTSAGSQWVDLTGSRQGQKDVFVQLDYMCYKIGADKCDTSTSFSNSLNTATPVLDENNTTNTTYAGPTSFATPIPLNTFVTISGFTKIPAGLMAPPNNGNFIVVDCLGNQTVVNDYVSCTGPQIKVNNPNGVAEPGASATATFTSYSFDPRVTDTITGVNSFDEVNAAYASNFNKASITLHPDWHAMQETPGCTDTQDPVSGVWSYCPYLNQPGLVGWKGGFDALKGQPLNYPDEQSCETLTNPIPPTPPGTPCTRRFQHGRKDSYHEVIFGHAQGGPEWSFLAGTLTSVVVTSGNIVTFTTSTPHGLHPSTSSTDQDPLHRVTVSDALTNTILSGTYLVRSVSADGMSFTIQVTPTPANPLCPTTGCTLLTDPTLSVASGRIHTRSGFSDVGGADSLITLGRWDPVLAQQVTGTTFMHEFGHANGLTHGGFYFDNLGLVNGVSNNNYISTVEPNCKPNFQSVMTYPFQLNHIDTGTKKVLDYSEEQLDTLDETNLRSGVTFNLVNAPFYKRTLWYSQNQAVNSSQAKLTCEGFPLPPGTPTTFLVSGQADPTPPAFWGSKQDVDFNLKFDTQLRGHSDWTNVVAANGLIISPGMNLLQIGATGADAFGSGGSRGPGGGSQGPGGGSQGPGGGSRGPGGGTGEIDVATATAVTYPPSDLTAREGALDPFGTPQASPRTITLNWTAGFGLTGAYKVYRSDDGGRTFNVIATVTGNPPATMFTDTVTCNPTNGYQYFVTAVQSNSSPNPGQESGPSNTVTTGQNGEKLTGCYTVTAFSSPGGAVQGSPVSITWTLQDTSNLSGTHVTRQAANTLVAIFSGPVPNNCTTSGRNTLLADGVPTNAADMFSNNDDVFTFTWNNTDAFCAGSYTFELDLDHVQGNPAQVLLDATQLQLGIDVTDADTPRVAITSVPNGVVAASYSNTIPEDGGVFTPGRPFMWTLALGSLPLPPGLSLGTATNNVSGLLSGIPTTVGVFQFTVQVTDSVGNIGTQTLKMTVTTPVAQINQPLVPDSSVPGGATFVLTLNGTGFGPGSVAQWNGTPLATTFISNKQLTAAIPALDVAALGTASVSVSNPVTVGNKTVPTSNVDFFQITPATSTSLSRTDSPTGNNPDGLIAADFNGDGKLDLAIANSADNTVTILLGKGDGTFTTQPALATGAGNAPQLPIAGDFNGDGKLDLAVANFVSGGPSTVSIFLGNGDGTFGAPATYAVGNGATSLVAGDFNRDGSLDLAVANQSDATVSILLGNGDGTFQPHVDYAAVPAAAAAKDAAGIALGDFNRDGELDLVVANPSNNTVSVLMGNGDGTFQAPVAYATGNHPINFGVADLNGDGNLDLAVANLNDRTVSILAGNGNGTFQAHMDFMTTSGALSGPVAVTTGDFNGDGKVDLAVTNQNNNSVSILLNNGNGAFQAPLEFTTGNTAAGVAAGDFNGDGRLDVAVADFGSNTVSVMLQRPEPATNLAVTGATASQVSLTWTASTSTTVVGYNVYRGSMSGGPYTKVNMAVVTATGFTDITVNPGTAYFYVVTAVDPGNLESVNSNEVSATTPPQPPTSLTAAVQGTAPNESVTLNWNASTTGSVVSYNVYRATAPAGPFNPIGSVNNLASLTFMDGSVNSGTTYYYVVTAVANAVESADSNEATAPVP